MREVNLRNVTLTAAAASWPRYRRLTATADTSISLVDTQPVSAARWRAMEQSQPTPALVVYGGVSELRFVIRTLREDELPDACTLAGTESVESAGMYALEPSLFLGQFDRDRMVGACYGWPVHHEREHKALMRLEVIAILPQLRGKGHGRQLLQEWERRVAKCGDWIIDVGSAADEFFLQCGYTPVEYCFKVAREKWPSTGVGSMVYSHISYEANDIVLYTAIISGYKPEVKESVARALNAHTAITIFRKRLNKDH